MHYQLSLVLSSVLAIRSVAMPSSLERRDKIAVQVTFSDSTVAIGTAPVDVVFDHFADVCATSGLCDTTSIDINGYNLWAQGKNAGPNTGITITIVPGGVYPTWIHNGLLDALKAALKEAAVCKDVSYVIPTEISRRGTDLGTTHGTTKPKTVNECTIPHFVGITYQQRDAIYFMEFASKSTHVASGFCSTFTTVSGAITGAVNGVAGGLFTLLGLACSSAH